jgi:hypothetical protein
MTECDWYNGLVDSLGSGALIGMVPIEREGEPSLYVGFAPLTLRLAPLAIAPDDMDRARLAIAVVTKARELAKSNGHALVS